MSLFLIKNYVIIERTVLFVKFQCNETERLIVDSENWTIIYGKQRWCLPHLPGLTIKRPVTKFALQKQHKGLLNSTGHGTLETVERFLLAISRLIARRCDTVSALQRGRASDDSGDASSICWLSSVGGAFRGPCISTWIRAPSNIGNNPCVAFPNYRIVVKRSQPVMKLSAVSVLLVVEIICPLKIVFIKITS